MIANLFSSFDPSSLIKLSLNWIRAVTAFFLIPPLFWIIPSKTNVSFLNIKKIIHNECKALTRQPNSQGTTIIIISLLIFILLNNIIGLFPYVFTSSSHLALTLALALPLWLTFIIFGWMNHASHMFAHTVPLGTPGTLIPFIVVIETISNIIRPVTLSVRLIANIIAGHLLITLLGNQTAIASNLVLLRLIITQILLLTLETAVAIIQSYVFIVLSTLYSREVLSH